MSLSAVLLRFLNPGLIWYLFLSRAYVEKYLLEKSRLVYQEHNERYEVLFDLLMLLYINFNS